MCLSVDGMLHESNLTCFDRIAAVVLFPLNKASSCLEPLTLQGRDVRNYSWTDLPADPQVSSSENVPIQEKIVALNNNKTFSRLVDDSENAVTPWD